VSLLPNSDKSLRRTPAQFASEAAKRTYQVDLPDGGTARARAEVAYDLNTIQILNDSEEDWTDVEIWVNRKYVVHVPRIEAGRKRVKSLTFLMLYDDQGNPFPEGQPPPDDRHAGDGPGRREVQDPTRAGRLRHADPISASNGSRPKGRLLALTSHADST
jgi:hypothetical protein